MKPVTVLAALAAIPLSSALVGQSNCPKERAVDVPRSIVTGNSQDCGGLSVSIGGVEVHNASGGCPLFLIYEPEHSAVRPSEAQTRIKTIDLLDVTKMTFECQRKWFLFIPYDNACRQTSSQVISSLRLLETIPCELGSPVRLPPRAD